MKKILFIIGLFINLPIFFFAQEANLEKAVAQGKNNANHYVAEFRKLPLKKSSSIHTWCENNDYKVVNIQEASKDRFGGNRYTYVEAATFATVHDFYFKVANSRSAITADIEYFLREFPSSPRVEEIYQKLLNRTRSLSDCARYAREFPVKRDDFHELAFSMAKDDLEQKKRFINLFPQSDHVVAFQNDIEAEKRRIAEEKRLAAERAQKERERQERLASEKREAERMAQVRKYEVLKNSVGSQVYWTEKEKYKTGSTGSGIGDWLLGDLNNSTYVIEYLALVEQVIGDNVKVIIQQVGIKDPSMASINYLNSRPYVLDQARQNIGQTRVVSFNDIEEY